MSVLRGSTDSRFDLMTTSGRNTFRWSLREYAEHLLEPSDGVLDAVSATLARSTIAQAGRTVTDHSIEEATSEHSPPNAELIHLLFNLDRHLVAVEYNSSVMSTRQWLSSLTHILDDGARANGYVPGIRIEPVPRQDEVISAFRSFEILTRLRVRLRIPNPELDRRTERLRREMINGDIRDYTQDMRNPNGLSKSENALPFATAAMAQAGYKEGEVILTGVQDGKRRTIRTGNRATRGRIDGLKEFVRGMGANARTQEGQRVIAAILKEVDKLAEPPAPPEQVPE